MIIAGIEVAWAYNYNSEKRRFPFNINHLTVYCTYIQHTDI